MYDTDTVNGRGNEYTCTIEKDGGQSRLSHTVSYPRIGNTEPENFLHPL